ncbi:MAG: CPBP family intramembrane glutamic endopeptidase [Luteibacter sp.]
MVMQFGDSVRDGAEGPAPTRDALFVVPRRIASIAHLAGYVLIVLGITAWGIFSTYAHDAAGPVAAGQGDRPSPWSFYALSIAGNLGVLYYCWVGVHRQGGTLATLTGGRWRSARGLARDVGIAAVFWLVWEGVAWLAWLVVPGAPTEGIPSILPRAPLEVGGWIVVSVVAGFAEEIQSRGYFQQQLFWLTESTALAVVGQAVFFGMAHSYQGWSHATVVAILGLLYGALAAWRRNLRANMLAHGWSDIWEGWLKLPLLR